MEIDPYAFRQPSNREIWAGIKEADKHYTCCLCGEIIGHEDFTPEYVGGFKAHSACWQENEKLGHTLSLIKSILKVEKNYRNEGTFYQMPSNVQGASKSHSIVHELSERQAQNQKLK